MPEHEITLVLNGDVEENLDALYESGCDDALFGIVDGTWFADFDREAPTMEEAILSAISDVESVDGVTVRRVEPDDLVTMSDIAKRLDRERESIRLLYKGERGSGNFPSPISHSRERNKLWRWLDVARWAERELQYPHEAVTGAQFVVAVNAALELRTARLAGLPNDMQSFIFSLSSGDDQDKHRNMVVTDS